jgi:hypothetical protein
MLQTISGNTLRYRIKQWIDNFKHNQDVIHGGRGVAGLLNMMKGLPTAVVGSGPTLDRNIKDIHLLKNKALIIACDSAVKALENFGVTPDVIMITDSKKRIADFLKGIDVSKYNFVADTFIHPETVEVLSDAKRLYWYSTLPIDSCPFTGALNDWTGFVGNLGTGGCVATTAWWMASRLMMSDPTILVGLPQAFYDPAQMYSNEVSKTVETEPYESHLTEVFDIFGKACYTYPALQSFAWWFQDAFLQIPGLHINASEGGIMNENCLNMPLMAAIQQYLVMDFDPQEVLFSKEHIVETMFDRGGDRLSHLEEFRVMLEILIDAPSLTNLSLRMGRDVEKQGEVIEMIDTIKKAGFVIDESESQTFNPDGSPGETARVFRLTGLNLKAVEANPEVVMRVDIQDLRPMLVEMKNLDLPPTQKVLMDTMSRGMPPMTISELAALVAIEGQSVDVAVREMIGADLVQELPPDPAKGIGEPVYVAKHLIDPPPGMFVPSPPKEEQPKASQPAHGGQYHELASDPNLTQEALNRIAAKWIPELEASQPVRPVVENGSIYIPGDVVAGSGVPTHDGDRNEEKKTILGAYGDDPHLAENDGSTNTA